jgi:hypothetical protein
LPSHGRFLKSRYLATAVCADFTVLALSKYATIVCRIREMVCDWLFLACYLFGETSELYQFGTLTRVPCTNSTEVDASHTCLPHRSIRHHLSKKIAFPALLKYERKWYRYSQGDNVYNMRKRI